MVDRKTSLDPVDSEAVGYGKPPVATQFKKGQSGNPSGRPPNSSGQGEVVEKVLAETQRLVGQPRGARVLYSSFELVFMRLKQLAAGGHQRATKLYTSLLDKHGSPEPDAHVGGYLVAPPELTREEWEARYSPKDRPPSDEEPRDA